MINETVMRFITLLIGCVYPSFASYKILSSKPDSQRDQSIWLSYWVVYGIFALLEFIATALFWWVPFLHEFKLIFLCWLIPTVGGGSELMYDDFVQPFFARNEAAIDQSFTAMSKKSGEIISELVQVMYGLMLVVAEQCCIIRCREIQAKPKIMVSVRQSRSATISETQTRKPTMQQAQDNKNERSEELHTIHLPAQAVELSKRKPLDDDLMQLHILLAEAHAAQRVAISNHNLYKEYLIRIHSRMDNQAAAKKQPPKCARKPKRLRRHSSNVAAAAGLISGKPAESH